jgi:anti-anti-sigma factor
MNMVNIELMDLKPDIVVVALSGRLMIGRQCQQVEWQLEELLRQNRTNLILDMSKLDYIDSAGIGVVALSFGKAKNAGGGLTVAGAHGNVENVFNLTRVSAVVPLFPDVQAAAAALAKGNSANA